MYEEEEPHPVARRYSASETRSVTDFAAAHWARWGALARAAADADETVVLDGAFVQWPVHVLLRRDVAPDVVVEFVVRLGERLAASGAATVYPPAADSGRALTALGERRGTSWLLLHAASAESMPFAMRRNARGMAALFASPYAIRFIDDPAGRVAGFTVSGPALSRGRPPADFDRVG